MCEKCEPKNKTPEEVKDMKVDTDKAELSAEDDKMLDDLLAMTETLRQGLAPIDQMIDSIDKLAKEIGHK
jgi:hypothetical protein